MPLTDTTCRTAKARSTKYTLPDSQGLVLLVMPNGGKLWRHNFTFNSKRNSLSLGVYPDISLKMAREKRDEARQMLASGIDPSAKRKAEKAVNNGEVKDSLKVIVREWLIKQQSEWALSHYSKIEARLRKDVLPFLGNHPITEIKAIDILAVLQQIADRGALETANRTRETIGQIFRYAIATGRAERNPAPDLIGALPKPKEKHMAAIIDPDQVGALLRQMDSYEGTFVVRSALQLAPLVFVRPGELRHAEWKDINFDKAEWRFKASKTGHDHIVPLSRQALDILKAIQPYSGQGRYVFPSLRSDDRPMSNNAVLSGFRRMGIEKEEMSGHGFRAMARTLLAEELGYPDGIIEHQLAHRVRDVHGFAYNRTSFLPERKKMMQEWADYLDKLKQGSFHGSPIQPESPPSNSAS